MPAYVDFSLQSSQPLSYKMSSLFHGALIELLSDDQKLTDFLHENRPHPYAQHLENRADNWHWIISFLNESALNAIWENKLKKLKNFTLTHNNCEITLSGYQFTDLPYETLTKIFYNESSPKLIDIDFISPTAFRSSGRYVFIPDLKLIYQSLMFKYDTAVNNESMFDEEALNDLCSKTSIVKYRLQSTSFSLEGTAIPAFIGNIRIKSCGNRTLTSFLQMLLKFGEFSGVGIKTALGMGAVKISIPQAK